MKSTTEHPKTKQLYAAIATALALGASVVMTSHAQEGVTDPVQSLDIDIVLVETPEVEPLPEDIPDLGQLPEEIEPLPVHPEVAVDNDGYAYDGPAYDGPAYEGEGPAGLYNAIIDKQQKLGMTVTYDVDGNPIEVNYEGSNHGHQTALARLRENLERKLDKLDDGAEIPEVEPLPEEVAALSEIPEVPEEGPADELELQPALPEGVALDNDGNAYPEGGPAGLYNAITDKQQKLGMEGVYDVDGNLESVAYQGSNTGLKTSLARLRENLERKLKKLGWIDDAPEVPDTGGLGDTPAVEELAVAAELGVSKRSVKASRARIDRSQKLEKSVKLEKATRAEKAVRVEKASKPVRAERVERPQKPAKVTRVERPQRPEKISRVEKPQRPEKISRVEKPQRPQKPQKPEKPERPGRS